LEDPDFPPAIRNPNQPELATVALSKRNRFNEQWKSFQSKSLQGQRSLLDLLDLLACQSSNKGSGWIISMSESIQFSEKQHTILGRLAVPFAQDEPELPSPWAPWLGFILIYYIIIVASQYPHIFWTRSANRSPVCQGGVLQKT